MKVSREQAARNRDRIVEVASRLFRERGIGGIGVADLMKGAGMTHGGFYGHFESKSDLAAQACSRALTEAADYWSALIDASPRNALATIVRRYLSEAHRDRPGEGCILAALGPEAGRHGQPVRKAVAEGLGRLLGILAGVVPGRSEAARRKKAMAMMASMLGALILARAVEDPKLSKEILDTVAAELTTKAS
jgi:TetR/AcrR family transcriptional regulator, transcriptional repressor for nem operon